MKKILLILLPVIFFTTLFFLSRKPSPIITSLPTITPTPSPVSTATPSVILDESLEVLTGDVTVNNIKSTNIQKLNDGDKIVTQKNSLAVVHYHPQSFIKLGPETTIVFTKTSNATSKISQFAGIIFVQFKKIFGLQENFELETPTTLAVVRGTAFINHIVSKSQNKLIAVENTTTVSKVGSSESVLVNQGEQAINLLVSSQKLNPYEKSWLDFNQNLISPELFIKSLITPSPSPKPTIPPITTMPGEGYSRSFLQFENKNYTLTCIGANRNTTKIITDSANDNDCKTDCPVLPLDEYAKRNNGFAALNGMYFCPASYPQCADKKNSFDTLLFNSRLKKYINSDNNVYSTLPLLVINSDSSPRFMLKTLEWGRDTSIQAAIAGNPMLVFNREAVTSDSQLDEKQRIARYGAGAIIQKGDLLYLCHIVGANILETSKIYAFLGAENAINIDGGGSTAIWYNGSYKLGPGRAIPNAIIFAKK